MFRYFFVGFACLALSGPTMAEGVLDKIKKGADNTLDAVGQGAQKVGQGIEKGADIVGDTVDSTADLVTNEATPEETRAELDIMADEVLNRLLAENADAATMYDISAGYAAFDTRKISVFPVAAGYGRGVAVDKVDGTHTYMNMGTGGVGAAVGIGGFATQFVILFQTEGDFLKFVTDGYDATAETGAMYGDERTEETIQFVDGRSIFVLGKKGWRVAATASGTKYWKSPKLN
ncbi:hypothetical protein HW561_06345 [Rhodobacteraceae bacterium B1Z28]|uniref:Lipid-binding SYLF domain-containing protein n=1 Tax=Ruegeria haliotis TaxID=2747601 RepID=A0ABX2PMQ9_9RHOB|nr:hypothetical protein [Ruegeria haliotis]NVO55403.1 hypothetical protein [Ruegeria haliotis]